MKPFENTSYIEDRWNSQNIATIDQPGPEVKNDVWGVKWDNVEPTDLKKKRQVELAEVINVLQEIESTTSEGETVKQMLASLK